MLDAAQNSIVIGTFPEPNYLDLASLPQEDLVFSRFEDLVPESGELLGILDQASEFTTILSVSNRDATPSESGTSAFSNVDSLSGGESGVLLDGLQSQQLVGGEVANAKSQVILGSAVNGFDQASVFTSLVGAEPGKQAVGREVVQQAVESFPKFAPDVSNQKQFIELRINPPELGQMSIQVEFSAGQIAAQIAVSDLMTAELLASEKEYLLDSLVDAGFDGVDVDISHQFLMDQDDGQSESTGPDTAEQMSGDTNKVASASLHKAGLNLLA